MEDVLEFREMPLALTMPPSKVRPQCKAIVPIRRKCVNLANMSGQKSVESTPISACAIYSVTRVDQSQCNSKILIRLYFKISRKISRFQGRFQDFTKISRFHHTYSLTRGPPLAEIP